MTRWLMLLAMVLLCAASGCAKPGPKLFPVSGNVTLDGQPLAEGTVYFKTIATGDVNSLPVKDGKFAGQAVEGTRRVEVVAFRMIPVLGEMGGEVQESLIARRFNQDSQLTAEVTAAGPNTFEFAVTSK